MAPSSLIALASIPCNLVVNRDGRVAQPQLRLQKLMSNAPVYIVLA